jgi:hypothetical protein
MDELHEVQITRELAEAVFAETCARCDEAVAEVAEWNSRHRRTRDHMREIDGEDWEELAYAVCGELCRAHFNLDARASDDDNSRWWEWAEDAVQALRYEWEYDYRRAPYTAV